MPESMKVKAVKGTCRWCAGDIMHKNGEKNMRKTWHTECVSAYKVARWPSELRRLIFSRDRGICATCGLDTVAERAKYVIGRYRNRILIDARRAKEDGWPAKRKSWWDMDHVLPLGEAHGDLTYWDASNISTLCVKCHKTKSKGEVVRIKTFRRALRSGTVATEKDRLDASSPNS